MPLDTVDREDVGWNEFGNDALHALISKEDPLVLVIRYTAPGA